MVESAELLKDLGVCGVLRQYSLVRLLGRDELCTGGRAGSAFAPSEESEPKTTHVFLLLVDVPNLEPDVDLREWSRRVLQNVAEALWRQKQSAPSPPCDSQTNAPRDSEPTCVAACR